MSFEHCMWSAHIFYKRNIQLKGYRPFWGLLLRESPRGSRRIELYDRRPSSLQDDCEERPAPRFVLDLEDVLHVQVIEPRLVGRGSTSKAALQQKFEFCILSTAGKHQLAARGLQECQEWITKLNSLLVGPPEPGIVYEFQVQVLPTTHSDRLRLNGCYVLNISDTGIELYSANGTLPTLFQCSLAHISKVQCSTAGKQGTHFTVLVIQTDRNAQIGEGGYAFAAKSASYIQTTIEFRRKLLLHTRASTKVPHNEHMRSSSFEDSPTTKSANTRPVLRMYSPSFVEHLPFRRTSSAQPVARRRVAGLSAHFPVERFPSDPVPLVGLTPKKTPKMFLTQPSVDVDPPPIFPGGSPEGSRSHSPQYSPPRKSLTSPRHPAQLPSIHRRSTPDLRSTVSSPPPLPARQSILNPARKLSSPLLPSAQQRSTPDLRSAVPPSLSPRQSSSSLLYTPELSSPLHRSVKSDSELALAVRPTPPPRPTYPFRRRSQVNRRRSSDDSDFECVHSWLGAKDEESLPGLEEDTAPATDEAGYLRILPPDILESDEDSGDGETPEPPTFKAANPASKDEHISILPLDTVDKQEFDEDSVYGETPQVRIFKSASPASEGDGYILPSDIIDRQHSDVYVDASLPSRKDIEDTSFSSSSESPEQQDDTQLEDQYLAIHTPQKSFSDEMTQGAVSATLVDQRTSLMDATHTQLEEPAEEIHFTDNTSPSSAAIDLESLLVNGAKGESEEDLNSVPKFIEPYSARRERTYAFISSDSPSPPPEQAIDSRPAAPLPVSSGEEEEEEEDDDVYSYIRSGTRYRVGKKVHLRGTYLDQARGTKQWARIKDDSKISTSDEPGARSAVQGEIPEVRGRPTKKPAPPPRPPRTL